jgi:hypothetical protein
MKKSRKRARGQFKQGLIVSRDQVPEGYVPLVHFGDKEGASLSEAAKKGLIPSVKLMRTPTDRFGPVFADKTNARGYLDRNYYRVKEKTPAAQEKNEGRAQEQDSMFVSSSRVKALEGRVETLTSTNKTMNEALNRTLKRLYAAEQKIRALEEHRGFEVKGIREDNPAASLRQ